MIVCSLLTTTKALHTTEKQVKANQLPDKSTCVVAIGRKMCSGCSRKESLATTKEKAVRLTESLHCKI